MMKQFLIGSLALAAVSYAQIGNIDVDPEEEEDKKN